MRGPKKPRAFHYRMRPESLKTACGRNIGYLTEMVESEAAVTCMQCRARLEKERVQT